MLHPHEVDFIDVFLPRRVYNTKRGVMLTQEASQLLRSTDKMIPPASEWQYNHWVSCWHRKHPTGFGRTHKRDSSCVGMTIQPPGVMLTQEASHSLRRTHKRDSSCVGMTIPLQVSCSHRKHPTRLESTLQEIPPSSEWQYNHRMSCRHRTHPTRFGRTDKRDSFCGGMTIPKGVSCWRRKHLTRFGSILQEIPPASEWILKNFPPCCEYVPSLNTYRSFL
jgi:hypothetical protein